MSRREERWLQRAVAEASVANDVTALEALAESGSASVRASVMLSLARQKPSHEARSLARRCARDEDTQVRRFALRVLWRMPHPQNADVLTAALDDPDDQTRLWGAMGLGAIGATHAGPGLMQASVSADRDLRQEAAKWLPLDSPHLRELASDPERRVRRQAQKRLNRG